MPRIKAPAPTAEEIQARQKRDAQVKRCQSSDMGYGEAHADAEERMGRGEVQTFCETCERYTWTDRRCAIFKEGK